MSSLGPPGNSQRIVWLCLIILWNQFSRYLSIWRSYFGTFYLTTFTGCMFLFIYMN